MDWNLEKHGKLRENLYPNLDLAHFPMDFTFKMELMQDLNKQRCLGVADTPSDLNLVTFGFARSFGGQIPG